MFLGEHLSEVLRAREEGVPIEAYFAWSLMDNFEWSEGNPLRYGVFHVDFATQQRSPKDSAKLLRTLGRPVTGRRQWLAWRVCLNRNRVRRPPPGPPCCPPGPRPPGSAGA